MLLKDVSYVSKLRDIYIERDKTGVETNYFVESNVQNCGANGSASLSSFLLLQ
jgi:hypothetical protein